MNRESGKRKIYFVDQTSEGDHHMVFNASILKILIRIFPKANIGYYGIASNHKSVKQLLDTGAFAGITFSEIKNPKIKSRNNVLKILNYLRKELIRFRMFHKLLKKGNKDDLIFLSITTFTAFFFFKFLKTYYRTKVIAVLHGDIDFIYFPSSRLDKINAATHKMIFKKKLPDFKYLLLNKIAKKHLVRDGYLKPDEVFEIDHPFTFLHAGNSKEDIHEDQILRIGHIGSMEVERKNSHYIYSLAKKFKKEIGSNLLQFRVAGLITPAINRYKNEWVHEVVGNEDPEKPKYLTRVQYEKELELLDYCIFFYPKQQYIFRASGAVSDFISKRIPIIVLKHPYFEYLFNIAGNIGFMCDTMDGMEQLIHQLSNKEDDLLKQYAIQQHNMDCLKSKMSLTAIANDLKSQISSYLHL